MVEDSSYSGMGLAGRKSLWRFPQPLAVLLWHKTTFSNAVHQALKRIDVATPEPVEAVRALLHGAMALYLARYLNVPPASLPGERGDSLNDLPVAAKEICAALLDAFDRQRQIDSAARLV